MNNQNTIAIIACLKMEELYIKEWLDYHIKIGVDHFYLCDNNDSDYSHKLSDVVSEYIDNGIVEVFDYSGVHPIQPSCYQDIYEKYGDIYDWYMVIDIDEFLDIPITNNDLKKFLYRLDKYNKDYVALMWRQYDDNDLLEYDGRGCLERFTRPATCFKDGVWNIIDGVSLKTKSLFRNKRYIYEKYKVLPFINHQHCAFSPKLGIQRYDVLGNKINNKTFISIKKGYETEYANKIYNICYLKHFYCKTIQEFIEFKINRGDTLQLKDANEYPYNLGRFFGKSQETDEKDKYLFEKYGIKRGKYADYK